MKTEKTIAVLTISAQFVNTKKEFKWRMIASNGEISDWSQYYQGVQTHRFKDGAVWALCSDYWAGTLPTEVPFQLTNIPINFKAQNENH